MISLARLHQTDLYHTTAVSLFDYQTLQRCLGAGLCLYLMIF